MRFDEVLLKLPINQQEVIRRMMALYAQIDGQTEEFAKQTNLRCKSGCGACCENPKIETSVAELLPLAVYLLASNLAQRKLEELRQQSSQEICVFYQALGPHQGRCGIYAYRPGICRLFGFSSRRNKHGSQEFVTCKIIKETQAQECAEAQKQLDQNKLQAPSLTLHGNHVAEIDPTSGQNLIPINEAVMLAIEKISYAFEKSNQ